LSVSPLPILIPLLNANESECLLAALYIKEGQAVQAGQILASLESTKTSSDLLAERSGFIIGLRLQTGQTVHTGDLLGYLAESAGDALPVSASPAASANTSPILPPGLRISKPALALAQSQGLDLSLLPQGPLVTERQVASLLENLQSRAAQPDLHSVILYGGGGHAKALIDLIRAQGKYRLAGVLDDQMAPGDTVLGVPVLGGGGMLPSLYRQGLRLAVNAVGGIGSITSRLKVYEKLAAAGFTCPTVVHPTAWVEASAHVGEGGQIFAQAYVGSDARVAYGVIINTGAVASHDVVLGDYVNISPGALLAGMVQVGPRTLVGMGVTINLNVRLGADVRIGNGATIKSDVPDGGLVRAGGIWPERPADERSASSHVS